MKLTLDNIIFSLQKMGGISVYWYELLKRISQEQDIKTEIYQFKAKNFHVMEQKITQLDLSTQTESKLPLTLLRYLPFRIKVNHQSLFHSSYYRIAKGAKNIVTIYDFTYEFYRIGLAKRIHELQKKYAINHAAGIICISENTKKDLYHFFSDLKTPVKVIYIGKSDSFFVLPESYQYSEQSKQLISMKFVLFVGARAGYKNFSSLVDALVSYTDISLVIVGSALSEEESIYLKQRINDRYIFAGFVDDKQLNELYNLAYCFIYPSEYEGFGIPVCEAMAAGCPVIAMNRSSIPEVSGNAGLLCEDLNEYTLKPHFSALDESLQRKQIINRGVEQAKKFTWDKCYEQTIDFYKEINRL